MIWIIIPIIIAIIVFACAWYSEGFGFGLITGLLSGAVTLLLCGCVATIALDAVMDSDYYKNLNWEVVSETELIPIAGTQEEAAPYLIRTVDIDSDDITITYAVQDPDTLRYEIKDMDDNISEIKVFYHDTVTPALVTEVAKVDSFWLKFFTFDEYERYSFVVPNGSVTQIAVE